VEIPDTRSEVTAVSLAAVGKNAAPVETCNGLWVASVSHVTALDNRCGLRSTADTIENHTVKFYEGFDRGQNETRSHDYK
jgi:hypothetical protein